MNLRTVHHIRSTKLLTHACRDVGTMGHDRKLREVWYLIIFITHSKYFFNSDWLKAHA